MTEKERLSIIQSLPFVTHVFIEHSFELKDHYLHKYQADIFVMGDDWKGKMDKYKNICDVVYLSRTPNISTTILLNRLKNNPNKY